MAFFRKSLFNYFDAFESFLDNNKKRRIRKQSFSVFKSFEYMKATHATAKYKKKYVPKTMVRISEPVNEVTNSN